MHFVICIFILASDDSRYNVVMKLTDETHAKPIKQKFFDFFIILHSKSCHNVIDLLEQRHYLSTNLWPCDEIRYHHRGMREGLGRSGIYKCKLSPVDESSLRISKSIFPERFTESQASSTLAIVGPHLPFTGFPEQIHLSKVHRRIRGFLKHEQDTCEPLMIQSQLARGGEG